MKNEDILIKYQYLINQKFNMLTVLDLFLEKKPGGRRMIAKCKCDCGNIKNILYYGKIFSNVYRYVG